jgi:hypothetical protein
MERVRSASSRRLRVPVLRNRRAIHPLTVLAVCATPRRWPHWWRLQPGQSIRASHAPKAVRAWIRATDQNWDRSGRSARRGKCGAVRWRLPQ